MTRAECEQKILEKMVEIDEIHRQYNPNADKLSFFLDHEFLCVNNIYWRTDKDYPLNAHLWRKDGTEDDEGGKAVMAEEPANGDDQPQTVGNG